MENTAPELLSPSADLLAAFSNAQPAAAPPVEPQPTPAPEQAAVSAPAEPATAAVEPGTEPAAPLVATPPVEAAPAFDPTAWLHEQYHASPDEVKEALQARTRVAELEAEVQKAAAVRELLSDPVKAREFVELTSQDFAALATQDPKAVLLAQYKAQHPQYQGQAAQIRFEREFNARYPGYGYDDTDSDAHREDALLVSEDAAAAAQFMQEKQATARQQLEQAPTPAAPEGPTAEQLDADAQELLTQVDAVFANRTGFEFEVDGQKAMLPITNPDALKQATINLGEFITGLATTNGTYDPQKGALIAYKLLEDTATHAVKAAKGSAGPVVPMAALVNNPAAAAPAASTPGDRAGLITSIAAAARPAPDLNY